MSVDLFLQLHLFHYLIVIFLSLIHIATLFLLELLQLLHFLISQ